MSKNSHLRNRFTDNGPSTKFTDNKYEKYKFHRPMPYVHFLGLLCLILIVFSLVIFIEKQLPVGLKVEDENKYPDSFIAERAYNYLKNLTKLGPRPAGSYENEVLAVNYLKKEIENIIKDANENHVIELDIQRCSGAFNLKFLDGMTNVYQDLQNVVVRIGSKINSTHSLLINCHFDSVADSPDNLIKAAINDLKDLRTDDTFAMYENLAKELAEKYSTATDFKTVRKGASDDGASCAVMLEILKVLSKSPKILRHNIIFLFNGGEENFLPASHGFITQHKWAKEIRAFINLEACGAGGREVLFQAGPNHPWILETYSEEVPYPYASSLAQEIFQSGIIPGDTDYRIFRDFGNLSGLDFAWSANGYVYHTKFDSVDYVPLGSLQRTGENILALAKGMAQGHQLSNIEKFQPGNLVFFDFLGAFVIRWPMIVADIVNISSVIFSLYSVYGNFQTAEATDGLKKKQYAKKLVGCMFVVFLSWVMSVISTLSIAGLLTCLGRTMSWYARPLWIFFLYVIPTLVINMATVMLHSKVYNKDLETSPWTVFQLYYDAYQLIWTLVLIFGVAARIRSSFISLLWVFSASLGNVLKSILFAKWRDAKWLLLHISVFGLPFVQCFYLSVGAIYLFVPVMGRTGAGNHAEFVVSVLVTSIFATLFSFVAPLGLLVRGIERIFSLLTGLFLLSLALLILTPLGFPYSGDPGALAPQRFMITHTHRTFHDISGNIQKQSFGYWFIDMDINSPHTLHRHVPDMQNAELVTKDCQDHLYCGMPYLLPVTTLIWKTHWVPGPKPLILTPVSMNVLNRTKISTGERLTFKIEGPHHMGVIMSPALGVDIESWSLPTEGPLPGPLWNGRKTYFIHYSYGVAPVPLVYSIDFRVPKHHQGPILDIAVNSHYLFGEGKTTKQLKHLVSQFPSWTAVTFWTASYESWII